MKKIKNQILFYSIKEIFILFQKRDIFILTQLKKIWLTSKSIYNTQTRWCGPRQKIREMAKQISNFFHIFVILVLVVAGKYI
jgi:hypothetical protein